MAYKLSASIKLSWLLIQLLTLFPNPHHTHQIQFITFWLWLLLFSALKVFFLSDGDLY
jgi:hypothetical protein